MAGTAVAVGGSDLREKNYFIFIFSFFVKILNLFNFLENFVKIPKRLLAGGCWFYLLDSRHEKAI